MMKLGSRTMGGTTAIVWMEIVLGNGAPISGFPRLVPDFRGPGRGQELDLKENGGNFGDGDGLNHGVFWDFIPNKTEDPSVQYAGEA